MALEAQIKNIQKVSAKQKQVQYKDSQKLPTGTTPKPSEGHGGEKKEKPDWLKNHKPPSKPSSKNYRLWNGAKWYWCHPNTGGKCDGAWRAHLPSACKGKARKTKADAKKAVKKKRKADALKLAEATQALINAPNDGDGNESDGTEYDSSG